MLDYGKEPSRNFFVWVDPLDSYRGVQERKRWLEGYNAALPILKANKPPLAFFALNDYIGWGVYKACQELDLKVPDDISIVCFDDSDITQATTPPITVVAQRTASIAQKALELLERRLLPENKELQPEQVLIDVDLIKRESVASVASATRSLA